MRISQSPLALCPKFTEYSLESRARSVQGFLAGLTSSATGTVNRPVQLHHFWARRSITGLAKIWGFIGKFSGVGQEGSNGGHAPILLSCL